MGRTRRTVTVPSSASFHARRSPGRAWSASRTSLGMVVWPLLVIFASAVIGSFGKNALRPYILVGMSLGCVDNPEDAAGVEALRPVDRARGCNPAPCGLATASQAVGLRKRSESPILASVSCAGHQAIPRASR